MFYDFMLSTLNLLTPVTLFYSHTVLLKRTALPYFVFLVYNFFFIVNKDLNLLINFFQFLNPWIFNQPLNFMVKKSNFSYVKLFHSNRSKVKFNRLLITRKLRFNFLWLLTNHFKRKSYNTTTSVVPFQTPTFLKSRFLAPYFLNYSSSLLRFWTFLLGGSISPFNWETIPSKIWSFNNLNYSLVPNRRKKKDTYKNLYLPTFKNISKHNLLKKILINNFFYFTRAKIRNSELKYNVKLLFDKTRKNAFDYALIKPYYFLSNPYSNAINFNFSNFTTLSMYRNYRRVFIFLRKNNLKNKVWSDLWYKKMQPFFRHNCSKFWFSRLLKKQFVKLSSDKIKSTHLNFSRTLTSALLWNKFFFCVQRKKSRKFSLKLNWMRFLREKKSIGRRKLMRFRMRYSTFFFYEKKLGKFSAKKILSSFSQKRLNYRVTLFGARRKVKNFYIPKINRFFLWNLSLRLVLSKPKLLFKPFKLKKIVFLPAMTLLIENLTNRLTRLRFSFKQFIASARSLLITNNVYFRHGSLKLFDWNRFNIKSYVFSFVKLPVLWSKYKINFISKPHSFLHLAANTVLSLEACYYENSYLQRKFLYSFSVKSDIYKYVMRRYVKTKVFSSFSKDFTRYSSISFLDSVEEEISSNASYDFGMKSLLTNYFPSLQSLSSFRSLLSNTYSLTDWQDMPESVEVHNLINHTNNILNIRRIKFKPGYMNIWRRARISLQHSMGLRFRYQHRLTRYLSKYKKLISRKFLFVFEMRLHNILVKSRLVPEVSSILLLLNEGLTFVNGVRVCNFNFQVYVNDFIQLIISYKYYIYYKWLLNWSRRRRLKLRLRTKKKLAPFNYTNEKKRTSHYPEWLLNSKRSIEDIAKFLEVDFFTLSVFVIYEPFLSSDLNPYSIIGIRYGVINLYNWKYIT